MRKPIQRALRRSAPINLGVNVGVRTWTLALLATFGSASCSGYFNPCVDLVLHIRDQDASSNVSVAISQFAQRKKLRAAPAVTDGPAPESIRQINMKTTYYVTGTSHGKGLSLTYFNAAPSCKVVRVIDRGPNWTEQTQTDLDELRIALSAIEGVGVEQGGKFEGTGSGRAITDYCSTPMQ